MPRNAPTLLSGPNGLGAIRKAAGPAQPSQRLSSHLGLTPINGLVSRKIDSFYHVFSMVFPIIHGGGGPSFPSMTQQHDHLRIGDRCEDSRQVNEKNGTHPFTATTFTWNESIELSIE